MTISTLSRGVITITFLTGLMWAQEDVSRPTEGSVGAVTIDGELWNQLALRPVIPFGKLAVALDIVLYIDADGNIHKDEWDFSSSGAIKNTLVDKIYYVRYGLPRDPLFLRAGALDDVTVGYGILVAGYSNTIQYPQVRKVGLEVGLKRGRYVTGGFVNDFKENLGLVGGRVSTTVAGRFQVGISLVADRNQYLGLKDGDGDGRPDVVDDFPDDDRFFLDSDGDGIPDHKDLDIDGDGITDTLDSQIPGWAGESIIIDRDMRKKINPI
ncbi:MAG: thrombospondin type 3 repeat-containing protein, partial [Fidelibacterota bacterium]